jgi:hypothetical protein
VVLWWLDGSLSARPGINREEVFCCESFRSVLFHQPGEPFERLLPHPAASRAFDGIFESAVLEGENAAAWPAQKLHVNHGFAGGDGRGCLPDVSNLIFTYDPAGAIDAGLKGLAAIEIDAEGVFCYLIEDEPQVVSIRGLEPGFDVFGDAESIEDPAAVGLELEGKGDIPLLLATDSRHYSGVKP